MRARAQTKNDASVARTIRFPRRVRERIAEDAERCGRSFESHVVAILRRHYGEDVDIAPTPSLVLELARGSFAEMTPAERKAVAGRLVERGK